VLLGDGGVRFEIGLGVLDDLAHARELVLAEDGAGGERLEGGGVGEAGVRVVSDFPAGAGVDGVDAEAGGEA
jgi:hypothetical protein